jgi:predicted metalloprotease with PDZ domain
MSIHVTWDLTDLAPGSTAASTYGEGNIDLHGPVEDLAQAYYMAGPVGHYTPSQSASGFRAYWLGQPTFDPEKEMSWTSQAYEYLRKFYRDTSTASYRVFVRALPGTGGGTALKRSFMLGNSIRYDSSSTKTRPTLAHEMGHMWVGELDSAGMEGTPWFEEGLNEYYTHLLLLRSGLAPVSDYEREINKTVRAYFTNPFRNLSADSLKRLGFSTGVGAGSAQNVPYVRGNLYFAEVDARIRAASGDRRNLDDVILPLFERRRRGESVTEKTLLDAFVREIGPSVRELFAAMIMRGETIVPDAKAFGPCFDRRPTKLDVLGTQINGFEWVRLPSVPETRCREW